MAPIAGWYDDPRDQRRWRYWDGTAWTEHLADKPDPANPPLEQVAQPQVSQQVPQQMPATPVWGADQSQQQPGGQQYWNYGEPAPTDWARQTVRDRSGRPMTRDGRQVASWGRRCAARLLDGIFATIIGLPVTGYFFYRYAHALDEQKSAGHSSFFPSGAAYHWEVAYATLALAVQVVYEVFCLKRWGATVCKRALNISVRAWDRPGALSWQEVGRRVLFMFGLTLVTAVPLLGFGALIVLVVDYLWPLWDPQRRALHDKFAGTVVVDGPRDAAPTPIPW